MRWALGLDTHPTKIAFMGGTYIHKDDQEAPQVHAVMYEYAGRDVLLTFETRSGLTNTEAGMGAEYPFLDKRKVVGVIFIGAEGLDHPGLQQLLHLPGAEANPRAQGGGRGRHRRPAASGQHRLPDRPHAAVRPAEGALHRRRGGESFTDQELPGALRGAREGLEPRRIR